MSGFFVRVSEDAMPNLSPAVTTRAVAVQLVSESGYLTLTEAMPLLSVMTSGCQKTVERKSLRTCTAGSCNRATAAFGGGGLWPNLSSLPFTGAFIGPSAETSDMDLYAPPMAAESDLA